MHNPRLLNDLQYLIASISGLIPAGDTLTYQDLLRKRPSSFLPFSVHIDRVSRVVFWPWRSEFRASIAIGLRP